MLKLPSPPNRTILLIAGGAVSTIVLLACIVAIVGAWGMSPPPTATMTPATATPEPVPTVDVEAEYYRGLYDACVHQIKKGGRVDDVVKFCNTSVGNIKKSGWYDKESPGYNLNPEPTSVPLPLQGG